MPRLRAVTFDFWSTLVDGVGTPSSVADRLARLHRLIVGAGHACTPEQLRAAQESVIARIDADARERAEDVGPPGRWAALARELGIPDGLIAFEVVERFYDDLTLNPPAPTMPHVRVAVQALHDAGYRLGVICNTGMAGGRVLRQVLERHGLLHFFAATVFSNELGVPKPHPAIFEHTLAALGGIEPAEALHVGDMEQLDVEGARRSGMHAALYAPAAEGPLQTAADFIVRDWREFAEQVARFVMPE